MVAAHCPESAPSAVLVASASPVFRDLLRLVFVTHRYLVLTAAECGEAIDVIGRHPDVTVAICDAALVGASGLELVRALHARRDTGPATIFVSSHPTDSEIRQARELGAIGCLGKPVRFSDISRLLRQHAGDVEPREPRRRHSGRANLVDADLHDLHGGNRSPQVSWFARDISVSGAFFETDSPLPVGTTLDLDVEIGVARIRVRARVVRVQEPAWGRSGGIGVSFFEVSPTGRELLEAYVATAGAEVY